MKYAIHKALSISAKEIDYSIQNCTEIPGVNTSIYRDGWIIAEPSDLIVDDWTRTKDDYRIETLEPENEGNHIYSNIILIDVK